ncbi:MAG: hypothetical protein RL594_165 [Bacteroidota bacterium]|jgi:hypothetical protein
MKPRTFAPFILLSITLFVMEGAFCFSQQALNLRFQPTYRGKPVVFDSTLFETSSGASITVSMLKFYVSGLSAASSNGTITSAVDPLLIDLSEPEAEVTLEALPNQVDVIAFTIGVDSMFNESGPREGALDPRNGMYWTWATGYIFLKLEGTLEAPGIPRRVYEIHVGGYKAPYRNLIDVTLPIADHNKRDTIIVDIAIDQFFDATPSFDITKRPSITDARQASDIIDRLRGMFHVR